MPLRRGVVCFESICILGGFIYVVFGAERIEGLPQGRWRDSRWSRILPQAIGHVVDGRDVRGGSVRLLRLGELDDAVTTVAAIDRSTRPETSPGHIAIAVV